MDSATVDDASKVESGARQILESAINSGATDVHIEPRGNIVAVRYRRGGNLHIASKLPKTVAGSLTNYLKQTANLETDQTSSPQNGNYELKVGNGTYNLDVSTLPVLDGEKITIHINESVSNLPDLSGMGFWGTGLDTLQHALGQPNGLVLVGGRGHSISLALATMLQSLLPHAKNSAFVSEAEETFLPAPVKQVLAKPAGRISTESHLSRLAKEDYDVVAVSILRSQASVEAALEVSQNSLVLAGIPSLGAMRSLIYLSQVTGQKTHLPVRAAVGYMTARQLCTNCRELHDLSAMDQVKLQKFFHTGNSEAMKHIHSLEDSASDSLSPDLPLTSTDDEIPQLWHAKKTGCKKCNHTGLSHSVGLTEVCVPGQHLMELLSTRTLLASLQKEAMDDSMIDLPTDGLVKALRGLIDADTLFDICEQYGLQ